MKGLASGQYSNKVWNLPLYKRDRFRSIARSHFLRISRSLRKYVRPYLRHYAKPIHVPRIETVAVSV